MKKITNYLLATMTALTIFYVAHVNAEPTKQLTIDRVGEINTLDAGWLVSGLLDKLPDDCLYDGLVKHKEGTWEIVPDLAEYWEISPDYKSITFHLRKGVQFHKGYGEMTAEDVKFSFERIIAPDSDASLKKWWKGLEKVEIIDNYTAKLILTEPSATLFTMALSGAPGYIVSKKAVKEMGRDKFARNPVGTGPYEFVAWKPKTYVKLKAFKQYRGEIPKIDKLTFLPIVEDATVESALKTGELSIGRISSLDNISAFQKNPNIQVIKRPGMRYIFFGFVHNHPPFDNKKLREAVRYAIDVDAVITAMYQGQAKRAKSCIPPGVLGHWAEAPLRKVDLSKAKQLLKEGGKPNGFKAKFNVRQEGALQIAAEVIKANLAKIGVDVEIQVREAGAWVDVALKGTDADCYIANWTAETDPHVSGPMWFVSDNKWNIAHWSNPTYDKIIETGVTEMNPEKRAEIYVKAQKIMDEEALAVWLTHGINIFGVQKNIDVGTLYPDGELAPWTMSYK